MNTSLGLGLIVFFRSELPLLRANLPSLALIVVKILLFSVKIIVKTRTAFNQTCLSTLVFNSET